MVVYLSLLAHRAPSQHRLCLDVSRSPDGYYVSLCARCMRAIARIPGGERHFASLQSLDVIRLHLRQFALALGDRGGIPQATAQISARLNQVANLAWYQNCERCNPEGQTYYHDEPPRHS